MQLSAPVRDTATQKLLDCYPRIFFACHTRHVRDPKTRKKLSAHQASILDHLDPVEPIALMDLARHMGVTASTMSLNVERLVRHGYVIRQRDTRDKRRIGLRVSAAGERIKEAQSVLEPARVAGLLRLLSVQEREQGLRGLELLADAAQRMMTARADGKSRRRRVRRSGRWE
ncbi:MAG: winged helix-turn-helix transcriptional regulator [Acidobacteria bacterium]|nr:winged helix-turn-helix transcriptional regulator [Acidobacteriota bacterium]